MGEWAGVDCHGVLLIFFGVEDAVWDVFEGEDGDGVGEVVAVHFQRPGVVFAGVGCVECLDGVVKVESSGGGVGA